MFKLIYLILMFTMILLNWLIKPKFTFSILYLKKKKFLINIESKF